jgi:hypothetical protein
MEIVNNLIGVWLLLYMLGAESSGIDSRYVLICGHTSIIVSYQLLSPQAVDMH